MATPETEVQAEMIPQQSVLDTAFERRSTLKGPGKPEHGKKIPNATVGEAPFHPSPSLDPGVVRHAAGEHWEELRGYLAPAEQAFSLATETLKMIDNARIQVAKDPSKNPHAVLLIVAEAAGKKMDQVSRAFDRARADMTASADALERSLSAPLEAKSSTPISAELRGLVRAMTHEDLRKFIMEALQEGDMDVLTSVLGVNHKLTGLSKEERAHFTRIYRDAVDPAASRRLAATRKGIELLEQRGGIFITGVEKAMGSTWATVQKLRKASSEAERALLMERASA